MKLELETWDDVHAGNSSGEVIRHTNLFGENSWQIVDDWVQTDVSLPHYDSSDIEDGAATGAVRAPINGRVAKLFVGVGAKVEKGDKIAVVEAMKMEHVITAAVAGTIDKVSVSEGVQVNQGALLAHIVVA